MSRLLCSYPYSTHQLKLLEKHGFIHEEDIREISPSELSRELEVSCSDALSIINVVKKPAPDLDPGNDKSALELLREEEQQSPIVTFCAALDDILGGGIPVGKITEICGAPGMGKTQFGMQLVVDVQIAEAFGGVEGEAIYIDCEGSFLCERLVEIAEAAVTHIRSISEQEDQDYSNIVSKFTIGQILHHIHVYRCHDYSQLLALSHVLPDFIEKHPKVKLIVLDSIAFHFRHDFDDMGMRTRLLHGLVQQFMKMAYDNKLAVVFMNQMTTKISNNENSKLIPALGQSWGHACTIRLILDSKNGQRFAHLLKSPYHENATVPFDITSDGVRDIATDDDDDNDDQNQTATSESSTVPDEAPAKRQKINL